MRRLRKQDLSNSVAVVDGGAKNKAYTNRRPRSAQQNNNKNQDWNGKKRVGKDYNVAIQSDVVCGESNRGTKDGLA